MHLPEFMKKLSDLSKQIKKPFIWRITCYELLFQCYLFVLARFVRIFYDFYFFNFGLALISLMFFHIVLFFKPEMNWYYW